MMPQITGKAKRVRIYLCQNDRTQRTTLYDLVLTKARELDMAGASVFRGIEGYGANCRVHSMKRFGLSCNSPILVEIIDSEEYVAQLLPVLDGLVSEGMVTVDDVEIVMYGSRRQRCQRS